MNIPSQQNGAFLYVNRIGPRFGCRYVGHEIHGAAVAGLLEKLGLPQPETAVVYGGHGHDMLFLDSHGVTLRIGHTDIEDLAHPAIIQPLGWVQDEDSGINIVIYPGILHYDEDESAAHDFTISALRTFMGASGQRANDMGNRNIGTIPTLHGTQTRIVPIVLDPDNDFVGSESTGKVRKKEWKDNHPEMVTGGLLENAGDGAISDALMQAFAVHQPLRHMFWRERQDDDGNMRAFWDRCARILRTPERVLTHEWTQRVNENGIPVWRKEEYLTENMGLYRAWTGAAEDKMVKHSGAARRWHQYVEHLNSNEIDKVPARLLENRSFIRYACPSCPGILRHMPAAYADDPGFMGSLPLNAMIIAIHSSSRLRNDAAYMKKLIFSDSGAAQYIGDELRYNEEAFMDLARHRTAVLAQMPQEWLHDSALIARHITKVPSLYPRLPLALQLQEDIAGLLFAEYPGYILKAPGAVQRHPALLAIAMKASSMVLELLPDDVRRDAALNHKLCMRMPEAIHQVHDSLRDNKDFMLQLIATNPGFIGSALCRRQTSTAAFIRKAIAIQPAVAAPYYYAQFNLQVQADPAVITATCAWAHKNGESFLCLPRSATANIDLMIQIARLTGAPEEQFPRTVRKNQQFRNAIYGKLSAQPAIPAPEPL